MLCQGRWGGATWGIKANAYATKACATYGALAGPRQLPCSAKGCVQVHKVAGATSRPHSPQLQQQELTQVSAQAPILLPLLDGSSNSWELVAAPTQPGTRATAPLEQLLLELLRSCSCVAASSHQLLQGRHHLAMAQQLVANAVWVAHEGHKAATCCRSRNLGRGLLH